MKTLVSVAVFLLLSGAILRAQEYRGPGWVGSERESAEAILTVRVSLEGVFSDFSKDCPVRSSRNIGTEKEVSVLVGVLIGDDFSFDITLAPQAEGFLMTLSAERHPVEGKEEDWGEKVMIPYQKTIEGTAGKFSYETTWEKEPNPERSDSP